MRIGISLTGKTLSDVFSGIDKIVLLDKTTEHELIPEICVHSMNPSERDLRKILGHYPEMDKIITHRDPAEGKPEEERKKYSHLQGERLAFLKNAVAYHVSHIDVELPYAKAFERSGPTKVIVSVHDFNGTPLDLVSVYERICETNPDVAKIAAKANSEEEVSRMLELHRYVRDNKKKVPLIGISMGPLGTDARVESLFCGAYLSFACLEEGSQAAPGQIPIKRKLQLIKEREAIQHTKTSF